MKWSRKRGEWLAALRQDATLDQATKDLDAFDERCLEPIITMQRSLITEYIRECGKRHDKSFLVYNNAQKIEVANEIIHSLVQEKYLMIGMIVAFFTPSELRFFHANRHRVIRRIQKRIIRIIREEPFTLA